MAFGEIVLAGFSGYSRTGRNSILPPRGADHSAEFGSSCPLTELATKSRSRNFRYSVENLCDLDSKRWGISLGPMNPCVVM